MKYVSMFAMLLGLAIGHSSFATEVEHVDSQCPDLNGVYNPNNEYDVMRVETSRGAAGEFRFGIAFYADGWISTDPVDGVTKREMDAGSSYRYACNNQTIYLYRNGTDVQMETRWSLDSSKNLVEFVINKGVESTKIYPRIRN